MYQFNTLSLIKDCHKFLLVCADPHNPRDFKIRSYTKLLLAFKNRGYSQPYAKLQNLIRSFESEYWFPPLQNILDFDNNFEEPLVRLPGELFYVRNYHTKDSHFDITRCLRYIKCIEKSYILDSELAVLGPQPHLTYLGVLEASSVKWDPKHVENVENLSLVGTKSDELFEIIQSFSKLKHLRIKKAWVKDWSDLNLPKDLRTLNIDMPLSVGHIYQIMSCKILEKIELVELVCHKKDLNQVNQDLKKLNLSFEYYIWSL